jgi:hypothetical protein
VLEKGISIFLACAFANVLIIFVLYLWYSNAVFALQEFGGLRGSGNET